MQIHMQTTCREPTETCIYYTCMTCMFSLKIKEKGVKKP